MTKGELRRREKALEAGFIESRSQDKEPIEIAIELCCQSLSDCTRYGIFSYTGKGCTGI